MPEFEHRYSRSIRELLPRRNPICTVDCTFCGKVNKPIITYDNLLNGKEGIMSNFLFREIKRFPSSHSLFCLISLQGLTRSEVIGQKATRSFISGNKSVSTQKIRARSNFVAPFYGPIRLKIGFY